MSVFAKHTGRRLAFVLTLAVCTWCKVSSAEPNTQATAAQPDDYEYRFSDDGLLGNTLQNTGDIFKGRPKPHRVLLLRPRATFVNELFKSVENL